MPRVFSTGSWYRQGEHEATVDWLRANGFDVLIDWATKDHLDKPKVDQYWSIVHAIQAADVCLFSFQGMEDRRGAATFAQFHVAAAIPDKPIVVYDPDKATREHRNASGEPVHPSFSHLFGHALFDLDNVVWTSSLEEAHAALNALHALNAIAGGEEGGAVDADA